MFVAILSGFQCKCYTAHEDMYTNANNVISFTINILVLQMLENPQNRSVYMCESDLLSAVTCLASGHFS